MTTVTVESNKLAAGVAQQILDREYGNDGLSAVLPWVILVLILGVAAVWLLSQPMEIRGTFLGS